MEFGFHLNSTLNSSADFYCQLNPEDPECWYDHVHAPFKLTPGKIVSAVAMSLLIIVSLGGNILVCTAFLVYRRLRKTTNYFIISLAVSDILVATVAMPMWLSYEVSAWENLPAWIDFMMLLRFWNWFDILAGVSSITNLTAISIDRCFSIMTPLLHRTRMTSSIAIIMVLVAWVYSITLASLSLAELQNFTAIISAAGFFLPLLVILISYITVYVRVKSGGYSVSAEKDWNLERTLLIVISVFILCWLPFFIFSLLYHYCLSCNFEQDTLLYTISFTKWMHYLNSCCNPFIYGMFNMNFKNAFRALLKNCCITSSPECEWTNLATEGHDTSLKRQIVSLRKKLRLTRQGRGKSLLSDLDTTSLCVTVLPGTASNRSSSTLPAIHYDTDLPIFENSCMPFTERSNAIILKKGLAGGTVSENNNCGGKDDLLQEEGSSTSLARASGSEADSGYICTALLENPGSLASSVDSQRMNLIDSQESRV